MELNFSKIEGYLNNELNESEKEQFKKELQSNSDLAERYEFYKNLKSSKASDLKPIEFKKKILPDITDINFTESKPAPGGKNGAMTGLIIVFIALSSFFFVTLYSNKEKIAGIQSNNDSLVAINQILKNKTTDNELIADKDKVVNNLQQQIKEKEEEIALLKTEHTDNKNVALLNEIEKLKKELAKVKQEYFENSGQYADDKNKNNDVISSLRFIKTGNKLKINWKSSNKYKVEMFFPDDKLLQSSQELVVNEWIVEKPVDGFYILKFFPVKGERVELLLELKEHSKVWVAGR